MDNFLPGGWRFNTWLNPERLGHWACQAKHRITLNRPNIEHLLVGFPNQR